MTELTDNRGGIAGLIDRLMAFVPARLRRSAAVVPVVRLSGVIGAGGCAVAVSAASQAVATGT